MIVVKLMGGLGNQMFQYAFAKNLAIKNNTVLKVDLSFLLDRTPRENFIFREYDLGIFKLNVEQIEKDQLQKFLSPGSQSFFDRFLGKKKIDTQTIKEQFFYFDAANISINENIYLEGYWQTEKYFKEIESIIKNDFSFRYPLSELETTLNDQILFTNSICVNFRRTDFVNLKNSADTHGVTEMDYYEQAVALITDKVSDPHFYIFSDDIEWCKENVKLDYPMTFVDHQYKGVKFSSYLQLMKNCKHFIIPNSTFAWWAAWLAENENKVVIAPKNWFKDEILQNQTDDIIPTGWISI